MTKIEKINAVNSAREVSQAQAIGVGTASIKNYLRGAV